MAAAVDEIRPGRDQILGLACDVLKGRQVDRTAKRFIRPLERMEVLIYVAGIGKGIRFGHTTGEIWDWTIGVNLKGRVLVRRCGSQANDHSKIAISCFYSLYQCIGCRSQLGHIMFRKLPRSFWHKRLHAGW